MVFSDSAVSFVKVRVLDGNIWTASLLLVTTFVELRVVAGRSRTRAGRPHAISGRPILIHTHHAVTMPRCDVVLRGRFQSGMVVAWQGNGMACVNQTRPYCVNQMGKTQTKPLAERHGICELAFIFSVSTAGDQTETRSDHLRNTSHKHRTKGEVHPRRGHKGPDE
jgi:hypothetical protein